MLNEMIKLTPKQDYVIHCLQNGWVLVTDCQMRGAIVAGNKKQFHINNGVFWRLVEKGLIDQLMHHPFDYRLTEKGENVKTKSYEQ